MSAPSDQSMNEIESEDEPITNQEESNMSNSVGFFSLPAELRVLVYRHLLVEDAPLTTYWPSPLYSPIPNILRTCQLIRQEAFPVMYGENTFFVSIMHPRHSILRSQRISETMQNVGINVRLYDRIPSFNFIHVIREFGSPAIIRRTLSIVLGVNNSQNSFLPWFVRAVPRFTNFRKVQIEFIDDSRQGNAHGLCLELCNTHRDTFTPVLGPSDSYANGRGLRFQPQDFLNSLPPAADVDWMDLLNGIRLNWNRDHPTDDEYEPSAQNSNPEA